MTDRSADIASFIRERRNADRGELLRAIVSKWPDVRGREIQAAIDAATRPARETRLGKALLA